MRPRAVITSIDALVATLASYSSRLDALELVAHRHRFGLDPTVWTAPTLAGTWANTAGVQAAQYRKVGDVVSLRGAVSGGTGTIFTLPVGFRPPADLRFGTSANAAFGTVTITTAGVVALASGSATAVWLDTSFSITT